GGVVRRFTVRPPPNPFATLVTDLLNQTPTHALATLDGSGSLLVPIDWQAALPAGAGNPVAQLVSGGLNVRAFESSPDLIRVTSDDVHSFTIDGKPLPPLIRATDGGDSVFGTSDAAVSVIRVARVNAQGQANFDLTYLPDFASHGPLVFTNQDFAVGSQTSVPLDDLKTSPAGAAFANRETIEADPTANAAATPEAHTAHPP